MAELKHCPHCSDGGQPEIARDQGVYFGRCLVCGATSAAKLDIASAVRAWNTRYERTCHAAGKDGKPYEPSQSAGLIDAYCDECWDYLGGRDRDHIGEYCRTCGAKVVEQ